MVKNLHKILWFVLFIFLVVKSSGQSFTAMVSKKNVALGEVFNVTFRASGNYEQIRDLKFPDFKDFEVLSQPSRYESSSNINGVVNNQFDFTVPIRARKKGELVIESASVVLDGKRYKSSPISIHVLDGGSSASGSSEQKKKVQLSDDDVFCMTSVSRSNIYNGEAIYVTQKVYSRKSIADLNDLKLPQYEGFLVEDNEVNQLRVEIEVLQGIQYYVLVLEKRKLFAQKSGKLKIMSPSLELVVEEIKTRNARNERERFWYGPKIRYKENVSKKLSPKTTIVNVKPRLNAPADFENLTGSFSLEVTSDKTTTKTNEPITLKITLSGTGNHHLKTGFELDLPKDIETYEPKKKSSLSLTAKGYTGAKSFEYLLVPRRAGDYILPSVELVYFDVNSASFKRLKSDPISIHVEKGDAEYIGDLPTGLSKKEIELRGKDIQFIRLKYDDFSKQGKRFVGSFSFFLMYLLPTVFFILVLVLVHRFRKLRTNLVLFKQKKASTFSRKRLKKAHKLLKAEDSKGFYEEVTGALTAYLSHKLMIDVASFSRDLIGEKLSNKGVSMELIKDLFSLLDDCEFARFAPSDEVRNMNDTYQSALLLLSSLEKEIAI
jgi:hypothetical protein